MDKQSINYKVAIIDPVGKKAGLDHYDLSLAKSLSMTGIPAIVYSNFESGAAVKQFPFRFSTSFFNGVQIIFSFLTSLAKARKKKVSVIIMHVFHASPGIMILAGLTKFFGFKLCTVIHDVESLVYKPAGIRKLMAMCDYAVVHNQFTALQLKMKTSDLLQKKIHIIPHGNFEDVVSPCNQELPVAFAEHKKYLLFFGMIKRSKGLDILLRAMKDLPDSIHLIIAGRSRDSGMAQYQKLIDSLNLTSRVQVINRYITNEERNCLFQKCDIVILPYLRIYQSGVMLMAMSYKKPVIASDLLPNREIINGRNGLLFSPGDTSGLTQAILKIAGDKVLYDSVASNGFEYVKEHHDWNKIAFQFGRMFK